MTDWINDAEKQIVKALAKQAEQGSVPAANSALKILAEKREASRSNSHIAAMAEMVPAELCSYLGQLGQTDKQVSSRIGRDLSKEELAAVAQGRDDRILEMRAIELAATRNGGKVSPWMWSNKQ